jgi:SAM-dependent methyltransferase
MLLVFIIAIAILTIAIIALILAIILFAQLLVIKAPYVKTPPQVIKKILDAIKINPDSMVYDLGCGDASFLIAVEKQFGARTVGFELSPLAYCRAKQKTKLEKTKTKLYFRSFFKQNIADADIVFCFLVPSLMKKVGSYLESQLKKNAQIISYAFPIPQWQPSKVIDTLPNGDKASKIYIYNK